MEKMRVECPNCEASFKAPAEAAGRRAKCPKCGEMFRLREEREEPEVYNLAPEAGSNAAAARPQTSGTSAAASATVSQPESAAGPEFTPCPSCGRLQPIGTVVCDSCGFLDNTSVVPWSRPVDIGLSPEDLQAQERAVRLVKQAVAAGIVVSAVTAVASVFGFWGMNAWNFIDVALIGGLTFGVYRRSRVCAVLLFMLFVAGKAYEAFFIPGGNYAAVAGVVIFGAAFFNGIRGTFAYHRPAGRRAGRVPAKTVRYGTQPARAAEDPGVSGTASGAFSILAVAAFICCALGVIGWLLGTFGPWPSLLPLGYLLFVGLVVGIVAGIVGRKAPKRNAYAVLAQAAIVGSIICILLSILLPSLASAREYAKRAVCKANLRGIGQACCVYAKQNDGEFPPDLETLVELGLCTDKQLHCPSACEHPGDVHGSYEYIAGQRPGGDLRNVLAYDKPANHTGKKQDEEDTYCGGNVLFVNGYVEFFKPYARVRELVDQTRRRLGLGPLKGGGAASPAGTAGPTRQNRGTMRSARSRTPKRERVVPVVTKGMVYVNASLPLHFHRTPFCPALLDAPVETWTTQELRAIGTRGCDTCGWLGCRGCSHVLEMQVANLLRQTAEWSAAAKRSTDDTGRDLFIGDWGDVLIEETAAGLRAHIPGWGKPAKCTLTGKALVAITVDHLRYRRAQMYRVDDTLCVHARTVYCDQYIQGRYLHVKLRDTSDWVVSLEFYRTAGDGSEPTSSSSSAASPSAAFAGTWTNEDEDTRGITRFTIRIADQRCIVHMWGKCRPNDCDWGTSDAQVLHHDPNILSTTWNMSFVTHYQVLTLLEDGRIKLQDTYEYNGDHGRSGRGTSTLHFRKK